MTNKEWIKKYFDEHNNDINDDCYGCLAKYMGAKETCEWKDKEFKKLIGDAGFKGLCNEIDTVISELVNSRIRKDIEAEISAIDKMETTMINVLQSITFIIQNTK